MAVDSVDDGYVEEYLAKTGLGFMQDRSEKMIAAKPGRKRAMRKRRHAPKDNEHMKGVLNDYDEMTAEHNKVK